MRTSVVRGIGGSVSSPLLALLHKKSSFVVDAQPAEAAAWTLAIHLTHTQLHRQSPGLDGSSSECVCDSTTMRATVARHQAGEADLSAASVRRMIGA